MTSFIEHHSDCENKETLLLSKVLGEHGFYDGLHLSDEELAMLREIVKSQWRQCLVESLPDIVDELHHETMENYHLLLERFPDLEHKQLWPKKNRILSELDVEKVKQMPFMLEIEKQCGEFKIANEEGLYGEEIYWRLARPSNNNDVGPMHADKWFWDLGHGDMPQGYQRVKIWIPLFCEKGINGLRYVPRSHRQKWPFKGVDRDGFVKPQIELTEEQLETTAFETDAGQAIVFNDELLHGGLVGGELSRVSVEFTILVPEHNYLLARKVTE